MRTTALWIGPLALFVLTSSVHSATMVTIDMVPVGNAGNEADTRYYDRGLGAVGYHYQIAKYEVTAGQYTEFLNAVAKADPNGLYNIAMADPVGSRGANILRSGSSPNYSYSVAADWADRPVNWVNFWDTARFANWLHNGQPIGPQGPGTTEDGAYHDVGNPTLFGRSANAQFLIPTEHEWYKAAHHDQSAGLAASYFDYTTGTNAVPGNDLNETTNASNNGNFYGTDLAIGSPYFRTIVGEFELSESSYGTFDQGGNVWEWNESMFGSDPASFGRLGGSFVLTAAYSRALVWGNASSAYENFDTGFRVASVPEPAGLMLSIAGLTTVLIWSRRKNLRLNS